jgi:hypothetical protein
MFDPGLMAALFQENKAKILDNIGEWLSHPFGGMGIGK